MLAGSMLLIFLNLIFQVYQSEIENSEFNIAINILNTLESDGKSFCFVSNNNINPNEVSYIAKILSKLKNLNGPSLFNSEIQEGRKVIIDYIKFIRDKNNVLNNFVYKMVESECHITFVEIKDTKKTIIEKLKEKQSTFNVNNSGKYLAIACTTLEYVDELTYLDSNKKDEVQSLVDIIVYNEQKLSHLTQNEHITEDANLVSMAQKFIEKHTSPKIILPQNVVSCLILKSVESYRRSETELIDETYRTIMFNGLRLNETCEISSLSSRIGELRDAITSSSIDLDLTNSHIIALIDGFESLSRIIQSTDILVFLNIQNDLKKYIGERSCEFNIEDFKLEFARVVDGLKRGTYSANRISDVGEIVGLYCTYANVNHYRVLMEHFMMMKLPTQISVYIHLIQTLTPTKDNFVNTMFEIIQSESEYIRTHMIESNLYRETVTCYLRQYKEMSDEDFLPYLTVFGDYLFNQYTFIFCPNKLSNLHHFAKSLSKLLPNFNGTEIFNFYIIEKHIRVKELALSSMDENVTWVKWYQYDTCFIDESIYNYHDIKMGEESALPDTLKEIMSKIVQRCSMIESTSNLIKHFNKPIEFPSVELNNILLDVKILKSHLTSSNNEEIWHLIETETNKKLNNSNLNKGEKMRVYCEVKSMERIFPDLTPDFLKEINIHILNSDMNSDNCLYNSGTLSSESIDKIVGHIKVHQSFANVNEDIIRAFLQLFYAKFVKDISDIVGSYSVSESLLNLLNPSTCSLEYVGNINEILTTNIKRKYKDKTNHWYPYFIFYTCVELNKIKPLLLTVEIGRRLSSSDVELLNQIYQDVVELKPELAFETEQNIDNIIKEMRNNDKFIHFNNELKMLLLSCHTLKIHSQMRDKSKDTTVNPSEVTTTTSLSTEQPDITTLSTKLTYTPSSETITISTTQISSTSSQPIITLSSTDKITEEAVISTEETITTETSKSTNAIDEFPMTTVTIEKPISESVNTTQNSGSTSYASGNDTNEAKRSSLSSAAIVGIVIACLIFASILIFSIIYYFERKNKVIKVVM